MEKIKELAKKPIVWVGLAVAVLVAILVIRKMRKKPTARRF